MDDAGYRELGQQTGFPAQVVSRESVRDIASTEFDTGRIADTIVEAVAGWPVESRRLRRYDLRRGKSSSQC